MHYFIQIKQNHYQLFKVTNIDLNLKIQTKVIGLLKTNLCNILKSTNLKYADIFHYKTYTVVNFWKILMFLLEIVAQELMLANF